ncbi:MAG: winged helix-turn-helix domain-containing protein [Methanotrichaceae archaeon]
MMSTLLDDEPKRSEISYAIEATRRKGADTDWTLYQLINRKPRLSVYELAKMLNWSTGKAYGSVKRLEKNGLVRTESVSRSGRMVLQVSPIRWQEFFTPKELEEFRNMEF